MRIALASFLLIVLAVPAAAQLQATARIQKTRYLAGEPILVVVDARNVGPQPAGYSTCDGDVQVTVVGAKRRVAPNIFGCYTGIGSGSGSGPCSSHEPLLAPGQTSSSTHVVKDYDLGPGRYELKVSEKRRLRVEQTLTFEVVAATDDELTRALAPLVEDVDSTNWERRFHVRAALIESAPRFLEPLIGRLAAENGHSYSAVDALGRIGTAESSASLKKLFTSRPDHRSQIVLALARAGQPDDAEFLARVLQDPELDEMTRGYAALGLGHIGGDAAVQRLEDAIADAPPEVRSWIATALGNSRSRAAVPALIRMWGNNAARNSVCGALRTLTHRPWCDGAADEPAATRRRWLRSWNEKGSTTPIFGADDCPQDPVLPADTVREPADIARARVSRVPRVATLAPRQAAPNTYVHISGSGLGLEDSSQVRVVFARGDEEHAARIGGSGRALSSEPDGGIQYMDVVVPEAVTPGRWQVSVHAHGRKSAPVEVEVVEAADVRLTTISPRHAVRAQSIELSTTSPPQIGVQVEVTDPRGARWRLPTGVSSDSIMFTLPDEVADGDALVRAVVTRAGVERLSVSLTFSITSGPLLLAIDFIAAVAAGQWTDIVADEFALRRADRIEIEFRQAHVVLVSETTGPDNVRVQVPAVLLPGDVSVRTRMWIENVASEWSNATTFRVLERPVPPPSARSKQGRFEISCGGLETRHPRPSRASRGKRSSFVDTSPSQEPRIARFNCGEDAAHSICQRRTSMAVYAWKFPLTSRVGTGGSLSAPQPTG